jgi:hypothetical protein
MQTPAFAPSLTSAYLKQNLQANQDNVVAPIMTRHGRAISLTRTPVIPSLIHGFKPNS